MFLLSCFCNSVASRLKYLAGLPDRFHLKTFDDFTEFELERIWKKICEDKGFLVGDSESAVVRRRLAERRNREGFGNARAVRTMFEKAVAENTATRRWSKAQEQYEAQKQPNPELKPELRITMTDIIGERPSRQTMKKVTRWLLMQALCPTYCAGRLYFDKGRRFDWFGGHKEIHIRNLRHNEGKLGQRGQRQACRQIVSESRFCRQSRHGKDNSGQVVRGTVVRLWHAQQR
jgi:hypothetical protein